MLHQPTSSSPTSSSTTSSSSSSLLRQTWERQELARAIDSYITEQQQMERSIFAGAKRWPCFSWNPSTTDDSGDNGGKQYTEGVVLVLSGGSGATIPVADVETALHQSCLAALSHHLLPIKVLQIRNPEDAPFIPSSDNGSGGADAADAAGAAAALVLAHPGSSFPLLVNVFQTREQVLQILDEGSSISSSSSSASVPFLSEAVREGAQFTSAKLRESLAAPMPCRKFVVFEGLDGTGKSSITE